VCGKCVYVCAARNPKIKNPTPTTTNPPQKNFEREEGTTEKKGTRRDHKRKREQEGTIEKKKRENRTERKTTYRVKDILEKMFRDKPENKKRDTQTKEVPNKEGGPTLRGTAGEPKPKRDHFFFIRIFSLFFPYTPPKPLFFFFFFKKKKKKKCFGGGVGGKKKK